MVSSKETPCLNPSRCGVKSHIVGSRAHADCLKANFYESGRSLATEDLSSPPLPSSDSDSGDALLDQNTVNRINDGEGQQEDFDELFGVVEELLEKKAQKEGITLNPVDSFADLDSYDIPHFLSGNTNQIREGILSDYNYSQEGYENSVSELEEVLGEIGVDEDELSGEDRSYLLDMIESYDNSSVDDLIRQSAANTEPQLMRFPIFQPTDWDNPFFEEYKAFDSLHNGPGFEEVLNARVLVLNKGLVESGVISEPLEGENLDRLREAVSQGPDVIGPNTTVDVLWYGKLTDANLPENKVEEERANHGKDSDRTLRTISTVDKSHLIFYDPDEDEGADFEIDVPVKMDLSLKKHALLDEDPNTSSWSWDSVGSERGRSFPEYFHTQIKDLTQ